MVKGLLGVVALWLLFTLYLSTAVSSTSHSTPANPARHEANTSKTGQLPAKSLYDAGIDDGNPSATSKTPTMQKTRPPNLTSQSDIDSYRRRVQFAADSYCSNLHIGSKVGSDGTVLWKAGNGRDIQMVYLAHSPSLGLVLSHQGTNLSSGESIANDLDFSLSPPLPKLDWLGPEVEIAKGFQGAWNDTASQVLSAVRLAIARYPDAGLLVTGHSLGASIALLSALNLQHTTNTTVEAVLFGLPRTGNKEFASAVDSVLSVQHHITHYRDPVPHLPGRSLKFQHPSGEVWIAEEDGSRVYDCVGQEDMRCADSVPFLLYQPSDHSGPYFGINMDCSNGTGRSTP